MNRTRAARLVGALIGSALLLAGCANLPDSSAPQALGTLDHQTTSSGPHPPVAGRDPDLLLHDFLEATADPTDHHKTARQYLSTAAAQSWDDSAGTVVVDKPDTLRESRSESTATYQIRARKVGQLGADGTYSPVDDLLESRIEMTRVDGEWRIDNLPSGVVIDSNAFYKSYRRYAVNFGNSDGTAMVSDLRWLSTSKDQLTSILMGLLSRGPQAPLAPAVRNTLAQPVTVRGISKGNGDPSGVGVGAGGVRIDMTGTSGLDAHSRELLAAQVVTTLSGADVLGPFYFTGDGRPLDDKHAVSGWTAADVSSYNLGARTSDNVGLHVVRDGALLKVSDNSVAPVPGYFGAPHGLQSVGLSEDGKLVAAVADSGRGSPAPAQMLIIGSYDGTPFPVAQGNSFTRPSWTRDGGAAWTVVDGVRVIRAVHDQSSGNVSVQEVDSSGLYAAAPGESGPIPAHAPITDLRISRTGARAAMIIGGKVYVATVVPKPDGKYALTSPQPAAVSLSTSAVSVDWLDNNTLIVARDGSVDPVQSVGIDGSQPTPFTSRNLTTPVRVVSASPNAQYVADSRAVMMLQPADPNSERFWREVQGLGVNVIPVLPG
ncbi:MAG: MtrAB system accessory protein LpqB [Nocardia sp.]|nr:MtrAB system accessory protein LpqB [Nocardia sp.]